MEPWEGRATEPRHNRSMEAGIRRRGGGSLESVAGPLGMRPGHEGDSARKAKDYCHPHLGIPVVVTLEKAVLQRLAFGCANDPGLGAP